MERVCDGRETDKTPPKSASKASEISKRLTLHMDDETANHISPQQASAEFTILWDTAKDAARVCRELPNFGGTDMWRWPFSRA